MYRTTWQYKLFKLALIVVQNGYRIKIQFPLIQLQIQNFMTSFNFYEGSFGVFPISDQDNSFTFNPYHYCKKDELSSSTNVASMSDIKLHQPHQRTGQKHKEDERKEQSNAKKSGTGKHRKKQNNPKNNQLTLLEMIQRARGL